MPPTSDSNVRLVGTGRPANHRDHPSDIVPDVAIMTGNNAALVLAKDRKTRHRSRPSSARSVRPQI
jgi:hypothetical protein